MPITSRGGAVWPKTDEMVRVLVYKWRGERRWRTMAAHETGESLRQTQRARPYFRVEAVVRMQFKFAQKIAGIQLLPLVPASYPENAHG